MALSVLFLIVITRTVIAELTYRCYEAAFSGHLTCFDEEKAEGRYPLVEKMFKADCDLSQPTSPEILYFYIEAGKPRQCKIDPMCTSETFPHGIAKTLFNLCNFSKIAS